LECSQPVTSDFNGTGPVSGVLDAPVWLKLERRIAVVGRLLVDCELCRNTSRKDIPIINRRWREIRTRILAAMMWRSFLRAAVSSDLVVRGRRCRADVFYRPDGGLEGFSASRRRCDFRGLLKGPREFVMRWRVGSVWRGYHSRAITGVVPAMGMDEKAIRFSRWPGDDRDDNALVCGGVRFCRNRNRSTNSASRVRQDAPIGRDENLALTLVTWERSGHQNVTMVGRGENSMAQIGQKC